MPSPTPPPLILASTSATRRMLLSNAGLKFSSEVPGVDEAEAKARHARMTVAEMASALADEKSLAVSQRNRGALVIGADQTLELAGKSFDKPADAKEARGQLQQLRGKAHFLHSAISCSRDGIILWRHRSSARLTMRNFNHAELERYIVRAGDHVLRSVGAYQIEGPAIQLFDAIEGDYFTVLGLPLLPLLAFLREQGVLSS